jgi:hypothetical protein
VHRQQVSASAGGSYCRYWEAQQQWRCRYFGVWEQREPTGQLVEARVTLEQYRYGDNLFWFRHVDCPVPRQALQVMPDKARVDVTFDPDGPGCTNYGEQVTYDPPTWTPWPFVGPQTLAADLLSPATQDRRVTSYTYKNNTYGTSSKSNCHGGSGWDLQAGGFTMLNLYAPFGPDGASGSFYFDTCGTTQK